LYFITNLPIDLTSPKNRYPHTGPYHLHVLACKFKNLPKFEIFIYKISFLKSQPTNKQTQTDRQTKKTNKLKQTDRQTNKQTKKLKQTNRQTDRQTNKQTNSNRQTDRQTDQQTSKLKLGNSNKYLKQIFYNH
jgi:hypothetical protein